MNDTVFVYESREASRNELKTCEKFGNGNINDKKDKKMS